jgi:L-lactate dehydrogenase complex protein LldG
MTSARERILARVRTALSMPAERPPAGVEQPVFPPVTDLARRFREELLALRGELLEQEQDLRAFLAAFDRIATDGSDLVREAVGARECDTRTADLGVTSCDLLIAQLGAIVVTASSAGGRALSVLPPVHLVIARRSQLVPDLAAALEGLRERYQGRWPSALSIIAGPSRTGDIEKVLVLGAHGPRRLVVWLTD